MKHCILLIIVSVSLYNFALSQTPCPQNSNWMPSVNVSATQCRKSNRHNLNWCEADGYVNGRTISLSGSTLESYVRSCDCEYVITMETTAINPRRGTSIGTLPKFGPEWEIHLGLKIKSLPSTNWRNILHISYESERFGIGSRYPAVFLHPDGILHLTSHVNGDFNFHKNYNGVQAGQYYDILIKQFPTSNGDYQYQAYVNGTEVASVENTDPIKLEKAVVYLSDPWYDSADVDISHLRIEYKIKNTNDRVVEKTGPFSPTKGHLEATLRNYGPAFKVEMKFKLKGYPSESDGWSNILHITVGENDYHKKGNRYPALWLHKDKFFHFTSCIDDSSNYSKNYVILLDNMELQQLYHIIIQQKLIEGKWMYQVLVDGQLFVSVENTKPMRLDEAKLYLSDPWYNAANVEFTYLRIEY